MPSIADILLQSGRDAADARRRQGELSGQAIAQVGQQIAAIPSQIAQQKTAQQENTIRDLQVKQAQRDAASQDAFEGALKDPANYKPDGTVDDNAVAAALKAKDIGAYEHWQSISAANAKNALELQTQRAALTNANLTAAEKARQMQQAQQNYLGGLAFHGEKLLESNANDPDNNKRFSQARDVTLATVARAAADGAISEDDAKDFMLKTASAGPDQMKQVFGAFISPEARANGEKQLADNAKTQSEAAIDNAKAKNIASFGRETPLASRQVTGMLDGKLTFANYDPNTQRTTINGQDVTGRFTPKPADEQTGNAKVEQDNAKEVAAGIKDGSISPEVLLSSRATAQGMALNAELHKSGVDTDKIVREWTATKRAIGALNGTAQVRLAETINKASASLDKLDELNKQWSDNASRWGIKALNRASLAAAKNGAYGEEAASVATRLDSQIADVTSELGQAVMGGNSPTDHALALAGKNLSSDWTQKVLSDSIAQTRYNLNLAQNARNDLEEKLGVTSTQVQTPPAGASTTPPTSSTGFKVISSRPIGK